MFAVVEFSNDKKEYSVVPLIWLTDNQSECLWPIHIKSQKDLDAMVEGLSQPKDSWGRYPIRKIHVTKGTYEEAYNALQAIITESSCSDFERCENTMQITEQLNDESQNSQSVENSFHNTEKQKGKVIVKKPNPHTEQIEDEVENDYQDTSKNIENRKSKRQIPRAIRIYQYSSDSDNSQTATASPLSHQRKKNKRSYSPLSFNDSSDIDSEDVRFTKAPQKTPSAISSAFMSRNTEGKEKSQNLVTHPSSPFPRMTLNKTSTGNETYTGNHSPFRSSPNIHRNIQITTNSASGSNGQQLDVWQQNVTQDLEKIKTTLDQQSAFLSQIWQAIQVKNIQALQRPADSPEFPVNRKSCFGELEDWLDKDQNFTYMRTRLASIGGTTVRACVMNMMKYLITNKLGMAFNWAGSAPKTTNQPKKYPFRETNAYKAINEAVKIAFQGKEQGKAIFGETTDRAINQACQDWLKQAKHRYEKSQKQ